MNTLRALLFIFVCTLTARAQVHHWRAEYDAADDKGDHWGERQGGVTFAPGVSGQAFVFDGVDDTIRLSRPALPPPWTLSAWVRRQDGAGASVSVLYDAAAAIKLEQWPSTRKVGFTQFGVADHAFNYSLPAGRWTHLTLAATASATTLYIDGTPVETLPAAVPLPLSWIGGAAGDRFKGALDEMKVWDSALTAAQVRLFSGAVFIAAEPKREWNPPVPNAVQATQALTRNGEPLAFRMGADAQIAVGPLLHSTSHYQGIQRWEKPGWVPYLFVTRSGYDIDEGNLVVVEMASRERTGERMRSNRLFKNVDVNDTAPPATDRVVRNIKFPYRHPGAIQILGDILAVALEDPQEDETELPMGRVVFYDISNPLSPVELPVVVNSTTHNIGVLGLTRLPDGHFLLVTTWGSNDKLEFYRSNGTSFFASGFQFQYAGDWGASEIPDGAFPSGAGTNFQCLSLFNQEDGGVYLLGARNLSAASPIINGEDRIRLFRIANWHAGGDISLSVQTGEIQLRCSSEGTAFAPRRGATAEINADFLAAVGHYVSPTGELLLYATEHWNDGPGACVRMVEFHHDQVARPGGGAHYVQARAGGVYRVNEGSSVALNAGGSLPVRVKPWIELYDEDDFGGSSVMVDWDDYFLEDYQDFRTLPWNDRASSLRWYAPPGYSVILYDSDNYTVEANEPSLTLGSTSWSSSIANLSDSPWQFDNLGLHETRVTSMRFVAPVSGQVNAPLNYAWQLAAADAPFAAFQGATTGVQQTLKGLDGPHFAAATVTVTQPGPFGNLTDTAQALIEVLNVAPAVANFRLDPVPGTNDQRARLSLTYTDPGVTDTHTVVITWGDGGSTTLNRAAGQNTLQVEHQYLDNDPLLPLETRYTVNVTITDSDNASTTDLETFRVIWRTNASTADGDNDGLPDYWEDTRLHGRTRTGAEDTDGDGRTNRDEYLAGTDPEARSDLFALTINHAPNHEVLVSFPARSITGSGYGTYARHYRLEYSKTLAPGSWQPLPGYANITGANQTVTYLDPAESCTFFRGLVWLE